MCHLRRIMHELGKMLYFTLIFFFLCKRIFIVLQYKRITRQVKNNELRVYLLFIDILHISTVSDKAHLLSQNCRRPLQVFITQSIPSRRYNFCTKLFYVVCLLCFVESAETLQTTNATMHPKTS